MHSGLKIHGIEPQSRPLFVGGRLRLGLLQESTAAFKIFDFAVDERSEAVAELDSLKQVEAALVSFFTLCSLSNVQTADRRSGV